VQTAAETLRANPKFDAKAAIMELGVGEALLSFLDEKGTPTMVERGFVLAPGSRIGPLDATEREAAVKNSTIYGHYEKVQDRESAYEKLQEAKAAAAEAADEKVSRGGTPRGKAAEAEEGGGLLGGLGSILGGNSRRQGVGEAMVKSAVRAIGSKVGQEIVRGVLGSILGGRRR
jgi:uncharacterized protein